MSDSDLRWVAKIRGLRSGACPVCGNDDLFWEKTPVHLEPLSDDRRSWWPEGSSTAEDAGGPLLECATCGLQLSPRFLEPPAEDEET